MEITAALAKAHARMIKAAQDCGRKEASLHLIAVSKTFGPPPIIALLEAGHKDFGENRVQEAYEKWPALRAQYSDLRLHLLGPLQSNKVKQAVALFDVIHSLDREKIARAIQHESQLQGKCPTLFVQVNTGLETQKAGIDPGQLLEFVAYCQKDLALEIGGLMCIPPLDEPAGLHFGLLQKLARQCQKLQSSGSSICLSMGMSADFETAIRFGATHIRVGSAIFGARQPARSDINIPK